MATEPVSSWKLVSERDDYAQVAQLHVIVRSGSLSDPAELPGLAHLTGRALLRGTRARSYRDLASAIERMGASLSVRTDHDQTLIQASVLARNLDPLLDLLCEVLTEPAFEESELAILRNIVTGEIRASLQEAQELASRGTLRVAYQGTPAERVPEGTMEGIARAQPADLRSFFEAHYGRANMVLGVVSPFEDEDIARRLSTRLDRVPAGRLDARGLPLASLQGRSSLIVHREGLSTTPVYVAIPGVGDADADLPALEAGNFVFGEDFTSRLMQVLRAENGWTYGVSSGYRQLFGAKPQPTLFSVYLFPSAEHAGQAIPKTVALLEEYARRGLTTEEFAKALEALGNAYPFKVATAEQRLSRRLRELLTGRRFETPDHFASRLAQLKLDSLNRTIASRVALDRMLVTGVGDARLLKPILAALPGMGTIEAVEPEALGL